MGLWSDLPNDILGLISKWLTFIDSRRFSSVCASRRTVALENYQLLMLPQDEAPERKVYKVPLPGLSGRWCYGSSLGWLVTLDDNYDIHLANPFSGVQVCLLPHPLFPDILDRFERSPDYKHLFIIKATLSASPLSSDCIVMAIVSDYHKLSFCRLGDGKWTVMESYNNFQDIIWYEGKIHAAHYPELAEVFCIIEVSWENQDLK